MQRLALHAGSRFVGDANGIGDFGKNWGVLGGGVRGVEVGVGG